MNPFKPYIEIDHYGPNAHPERPWWSINYLDTEGREVEATRRDDVFLDSEDVAGEDQRNPLPPPPPMVGQVWAAPSGSHDYDEFMITAVQRDGGDVEWFCSDPDIGGSPHTHWPPMQCVLVSGPGAPWAPAGWTP